MRGYDILGAALAALLSVSGCGDDTSLTGDALLQACIRTTACGIQAYPRVSNCVDAYNELKKPQGLAAVHDAAYSCVNGAASCAQMFGCFGTTADARCDKSYKASCEGNTAVTCDLIDDRVYRLDCAAAGLSCAPRKSNAFVASCSPGACDMATYEPRCDGDRMLSCDDGVIAIDDCAAVGSTCQPRGTSVGCGSTDQPPPPAGKECVDEFDRCDGERLQACVDGRWATIDCRSLGLGSCLAAQTGAACGPPT